MDYAKAFRVARAAMGMTQKEVAERAGKDHSTVSRLEAGSRVPSQGMVTAMAGGLGVPRGLLALLAAEKRDFKPGGPSKRSVELIGRTLLSVLAEAGK